MTPDAADALAKRIINTWRGGPPLSEWRTELEHIDEGRAGTAFARLRRSAEHAPTIARFIAECKAVDSTDPSDPENRCPECANSGWVAQTDQHGDPLHYVERGVPYSGAKPCRCNHGQVAAESKTWKQAKRRTFTIHIPTKGAAA